MERVSPADSIPLVHEFFVANASELYRRVLVLAVHGRHRAGAEGAPDTRYIQAHVALGAILWSPDALVLDLRDLDYPGGTMLRAALSPVEPSIEEGFPLYVACRADRRAAIAEALPIEALVGSVDEAIEKIRTAGPWALR